LLTWLGGYWHPFVLAVIVLVAAIVRTVDIVDNPRGFFTDEASFGLNAHLIWTTGRDEHGEFLPFLFRSFGEYKLPVFIYAEVPFVAVLGRTELAVRLTAAVIGSLTVITTYLMAKELFRRELAALAGAAFLAILPWHIHYSRTGLGDIPSFPLLLTISLFLFLRAVRLERSFVPAAVAFGVTFYTYRAAWLVLPPLLLLIVFMYRRELRRSGIDAMSAGVALIAVLLPIGLHLLSNSSDRASQAWIFNIESERSTVDIFWDFYRSYFSDAFLFDLGDNGAITRHYLPGHGVLYPFILPLLIAGVVGLVARPERRHFIVLALLLLYPLGGALSDTSPISSRSIIGSLVFAVLAGYGLVFLADLIVALMRLPRAPVVTGLVGIVSIVALMSFASYLTRYHEEYPKLSAGYWGWQDGPQAIIERFVAVQDDYDQLYLDGDFNAPAIFIPFYAEGECRKCRIGGSNRFEPGLRQLFALRPQNVRPERWNFTIVDQLFYPSGELAFVFIEISGPR
jgi:4-amino-4-deoxy-L-arabinose transferase-like glycosyltransferase